MVTGRLRQRSYEDREGIKRTVFEVDVEDAGPSLKWATAKVNKVQRDRATRHADNPDRQDDPWVRSPATAGATSSEPPF